MKLIRDKRKKIEKGQFIKLEIYKGDCELCNEAIKQYLYKNEYREFITIPEGFEMIIRYKDNQYHIEINKDHRKGI